MLRVQWHIKIGCRPAPVKGRFLEVPKSYGRLSTNYFKQKYPEIVA